VATLRIETLQGTQVPGSDLKKAGLKVTLPRLKVLEVLEQAEPHHMSAEDVYKRLMQSDESVGLATVYRVLTQFESASIVERHNFDDGHSVYELAADHHHDHMVDVDTGAVTEFINERIEALQNEIAEEHGYDLVDHELVLYVRKKA
jgi:Fur family ferric uptake transcriptional regulator